MTCYRPTALALAMAAAFPLAALAQESLDTIVVTAPPMSAPLEVSFDPRAPQQPLPANDGASLLKTIPGMSVIRKGGTDGDPMFRGMAASRLNILLDGEQILGGCGMRMDPPTAYVFPDSYDKVTLLKGPQSVVYGAGASAGTVLFERKPTYFAEPGWSVKGALTGASFGRNDEFLDVKGGNSLGYVQGIVTSAQSEDYQDGDGNKVHSKYRRHSATAILGWTPDKDTSLEFSAIKSDAKAAYADRGVDGSKFDRENYSLKFEKRDISPLVEKLEAQAYYNYVDHVMDSYSMRSGNPTSMMAAMNPDRKTTGGRLAATLHLADPTQLQLGIDTQSNRHTGRFGAAPGYMGDYTKKTRVEDAHFEQYGLFGELTQQLGESSRIVAGLRNDQWEAKDKRQTITVGMAPQANPSANTSRDQALTSGFARYEHDLSASSTAYVGLGHTERAPDYWELFNKESTTSISAFDSIKPEKTNQLDVGATWKSGPLQTFVSAFYSKIDDYILIQSNYVKPAGMMGTRTTSIARNVDATTWGGEAGVNYAFNPNWKGMASLAYVHGTNDTDDRALGQMPPLEGRLGLDWDNGTWSAGSLLRLVAKQDRYAVNEGNIVGQDLGKTGGFGVFSVNGGYRWNKTTKITLGVDNLFDKTYAESISRGGAAVTGYDQIIRVNEPGRTVWLKAQIALD